MPVKAADFPVQYRAVFRNRQKPWSTTSVVNPRHCRAGLRPSLGGCYPNTRMQLLRKFRSLNAMERSLLLHAVLLVVSLRAALCLMPFVRVNDYLTRRAKSHPLRRNIATSRLLWAIRTAAARIPHATCLTQALAAKYQLERSGHNAQLHLTAIRDHCVLRCSGGTEVTVCRKGAGAGNE